VAGGQGCAELEATFQRHAAGLQFHVESAEHVAVVAQLVAIRIVPVALTDEAMDKIAVSMGCPVESITFDPYPG
jgi:hypothetical protein